MTTYTINATVGTPSTTVDRKGAMDFDVTVEFGDASIDGETTLIPSDYDGALSSWGGRDHWMSGSLCKLAEALDGDCDGKSLCSAIAAACRTGEEQTVELGRDS